MPSPRIFVSSTCYDLMVVRSELRSFILEIGYQPYMSDYSDLLFDPRAHTHTSCLQEIEGCDLLIVIIGRRFGGKAVPDAIEALNFESIEAEGLTLQELQKKGNISITQLEVFKAIEKSVPVFAFVDGGVLNDHLTYEKNKDKSILKDIEFPNIEKQESAKYIFEFINFIRHRSTGNSIISFNHLDDIREHLKKQWAGLFQRLLSEQRHKREETVRIDFLTTQIADIKTAIFASLTNSQLKNTAKGAITYRPLVDFANGAYRGEGDVRDILKLDVSWADLLKNLNIKKVISGSEILLKNNPLERTVLVLDDNTYFQCRMPEQFINTLSSRWQEYRKLDPQTKVAIIDALLEHMPPRNSGMLRYVNEQYPELGEQRQDKIGSNDVAPETKK